MSRSEALTIGLSERGRAALAPALERIDVVECPTLEDALALRRAVQVVVVDATETAPSASQLDAVRERWPHVPRVLLGETGLASALLPLAEDCVFNWVPLDRPGEPLDALLARLTRPRQGARAAAAGILSVRGVVEGRDCSHPLLDLSNAGLSFRVPPGAPVRGFAVRVTIAGLSVVDADGRPLVEHATAVVRQARWEDGPEPGLRVGLSFDAGRSTQPAPLRVVRDSLLVAATIRKAHRADAEFIVQAPDAERAWLVRPAELSAGDEAALTFAGPGPDGLERGDVVRLTFDHHGLSYSGLCTVREADPLVVSLPRTLRVHHRRQARRIAPPPAAGYRVRIEVPALGYDEVHPVLDLHDTGVSARVDRARDVLPPGLRVRLSLLVPDDPTPIACDAVVRNLAPVALRPGESGEPARCGFELLAPAPADRARLDATLLHAGLPHLRPARPEDFERLWEFLPSAGFKLRLHEGEEGRAKAERAYVAMTRSEGRVGAGLFHRRGDQVNGYIAGLRAYERTWIATHLAAIQGSLPEQERVSRALCVGLVEHVERSPGIEYLRLAYRRDQRWVNHMFGWSGRSVSEPGLAECRDFVHLVKPSRARPVALAGAVQVRDAGPEDLVRVEQHFLVHDSPLRIRSEDLDRDSLGLAQVGAAWAASGLERHRAVRIATVDGVPVGFSLREYATVAVQMSELLSGLDVFELPGAEPLVAGAISREEVWRVLIDDALDACARAGLPWTVALCPDHRLETFEEAGFTVLARSRVWTWHRSLLRAWADAWDQLFRRGKPPAPLAPGRSAA